MVGVYARVEEGGGELPKALPQRSRSADVASRAKEAGRRKDGAAESSRSAKMPRAKNYFGRSKKSLYAVIFSTRRGAAALVKEGGTGLGIGEPSLYHALVIIFLEFFAWGLLTVPVINVIADTFPANKFLMNGLILGVKGLLSFLSAPMVGALSDIWGRKFFLLLTVVVTCLPIPWLRISPWWYFALFSISGVFSVTFSVVLAYVADITDKEDRSAAYGLVSATFGASLVSSPALGAWLGEAVSDDAVVALATAVAALDVFFILVAVPESLPAKLRHSWDRLAWDHADPFAALRKVFEDPTVLLLCTVVFLSYLPEAGQFSCFFVYLKLVMGFSPESVAGFIGLVGILSVVAQTGLLMTMHRLLGPKRTIGAGLAFQAVQLTWYGLGSQYWMMWGAGVLAAMSSIGYPSVSAYVSVHTAADKQGTVQGMVTGVRGLCQGLGPAIFGLIFWAAHVDLNVEDRDQDVPRPFPQRPVKAPFQGGFKPHPLHRGLANVTTTLAPTSELSQRLVPGPPFLFGALLCCLALVAVSWLPDNPQSKLMRSHRRSRSLSGGSGTGSSGGEGHSPLLSPGPHSPLDLSP